MDSLVDDIFADDTLNISNVLDHIDGHLVEEDGEQDFNDHFIKEMALREEEEQRKKSDITNDESPTLKETTVNVEEEKEKEKEPEKDENVIEEIKDPNRFDEVEEVETVNEVQTVVTEEKEELTTTDDTQFEKEDETKDEGANIEIENAIVEAKEKSIAPKEEKQKDDLIEKKEDEQAETPVEKGTEASIVEIEKTFEATAEPIATAVEEQEEDKNDKVVEQHEESTKEETDTNVAPEQKVSQVDQLNPLLMLLKLMLKIQWKILNQTQWKRRR